MCCQIASQGAEKAGELNFKQKIHAFKGDSKASSQSKCEKAQRNMECGSAMNERSASQEQGLQKPPARLTAQKPAAPPPSTAVAARVSSAAVSSASVGEKADAFFVGSVS
ncbi:MAG: hypothetical protein LBH08_03220 [Puniceicoccales bacterium]|nr:hypothetical protein [Puniceicoccales bacterium]